MVKKVAALVVVYHDGRMESTPGEKGEIYETAREFVRAANDSGNVDGISRVIAFSTNTPDGVMLDKRFKPAPEMTESVIDPAEEVRTLRSILKDAGVPFSPNAGIERLREQVAQLDQPESEEA